MAKVLPIKLLKVVGKELWHEDNLELSLIRWLEQVAGVEILEHFAFGIR